MEAGRNDRVWRRRSVTLAMDGDRIEAVPQGIYEQRGMFPGERKPAFATMKAQTGWTQVVRDLRVNLFG